MVDKERRRKLAFHLRHFATGLIRTDEFEDKLGDDVSFGWAPEQYYRLKQAKTGDPVISPMLEMGWCLYGDGVHRLSGTYRLKDETQKHIARWILFLHSDLEYEWPCISMVNCAVRFSFMEGLIVLLTLGWYYLTKNAESEKEFERFKTAGDYDYWPFISKEQYEEQLKKPPFLTGQSHE